MSVQFAERYWLEDKLGEGAHGVVWRARDEVTGEHVAVKLLQSEWSRDRSRARREIAALRLSKTPGVVRLLDEGTHLGRAFIVMTLIEGRPFPGRAGVVPWSELSGVALALLETLGRVHASGIVHCDIKPTNAWVGSDGKLTLLDFGIADLPVGRWDTKASEGTWLGTPAYLAPEVLLGDAATTSSDLYAVGLMLYEALSGVRPFDEPDTALLLGARLSRAPRPLIELVATVPREVSSTLTWMLDAKPERRPSTAREVMEALRGATVSDAARALPSVLAEAGDRPLGLEELRALFIGMDRIFHHRDDAARRLHERTEGDPREVIHTLDAWQRAGIVRWDGGRYRIEQEGIDVLRAGAWPGAEARPGDGERTTLTGSLGHLARVWTDANATLAHVVLESTALARRLFHEGLNGDATTVLLEAARAARLQSPNGSELPSDELAAELFSLWIEVAAMDLLPRGLDRLLFEIAKAQKSHVLQPIAELAQAALDLGQDPVRASARLDALEPFEDIALERTRASLRMLAARSASPEREREVLEEIEAWIERSPDVTSRARALGWRGRLAYRLNAFEESAALHLESARALQRPIERAAALLNSASACSEAFRFEDAITRAGSARETLGARRHPLLELRIAWVTRWACYRRGDTLTPDPELLEAAEHVGMPSMLAPLIMLESAVRFRAHDKRDAAKLARWAGSVWSTARVLPDLVLLCQCLAVACDEANDANTLGDLADLAARAGECTTFGVELQALGLLRSAGLSPSDATVRRFERRLEEIPSARRDARLDFLSASEALTLFHAT